MFLFLILLYIFVIYFLSLKFLYNKVYYILKIVLEFDKYYFEYQKDKLIIFSNTNIFVGDYNFNVHQIKTGSLFQNIINVIYLGAKEKKIVVFTNDKILLLSDFENKSIDSKIETIYYKKYMGGIKLNDQFAVFISNKILLMEKTK